MKEVKIKENRKWSCSTAECEKELHCFLERAMAENGMKVSKKPGACLYCEAELVDWDRIQKNDITDVEFTFMSLKYEWIRHNYWHIPFDLRAMNHARRKGKIKLKVDVENRIIKSVGKSNTGNAWDGRQTPWEGNTIFYAQHATATCCRKCIKRWHGIPNDRDLNSDEIQYIKKLIFMYLDERLPDLKDEGEYVPPIRKK